MRVRVLMALTMMAVVPALFIVARGPGVGSCAEDGGPLPSADRVRR